MTEALFSGLFAGFTQIDLPGSTTNNTMLFLQPAASKHQFITGLAEAVPRDAAHVLDLSAGVSAPACPVAVKPKPLC